MTRRNHVHSSLQARGRWATLALAACGAWVAAPAGAQCPGGVEFEDADFFIEINGTAGDAGVQLLLDGEGWDTLQIVDPNGAVILDVAANPSESVGMQGLTEFFFESAEPSFDDQTLAELFALFPEGEYSFEGTTTEGDPICATSEFTHDLPAVPRARAVVRDDDEVQIRFRPVRDAFEDPGDPPAEVGQDIEIASYRIIVQALDADGEGLEKLDVELPARLRRMTIPPEFLALSPVGEFKYEVIAKEESGNQTILEAEFSLEDEDDDDDHHRSRH